MDLVSVPSFYFSPKVVLVDDDLCLLETLKDSLSEYFDVESFCNPVVFLESMQNFCNIVDIVNCTRELNEDSSDKQSVVKLNVMLLAEKLQNEYKADKLVSICFVDYFMPGMTGIECVRQIKDSYLCKVLLTSSLDNKDVISAFNHKYIQQYMPKTSDNLLNEMRATVENNHMDVINELNRILYGDFFHTSPYLKVYSNDEFIKIYENILKKESIRFSCVYESGGSMLMCDNNNNTYLLNIYSTDEIQNVLFESVEFEHNISDYNKKLCKSFKILVDYKNNVTGIDVNSYLSNKLIETYDLLSIEGETYYLSFNKLLV